jgi:hypothetical protein
MITPEHLDNWFTYHAPTEADQVAYIAIRQAAKDLATIILTHTPAGNDQSAALRKVREAVWTANSAVACRGK